MAIEGMTTEERLDDMEQELRRVKRWNLCLLVGAVTCLGVGFIVWALGSEPPPTQAARAGMIVTGAKEIRARKFVLEDDSGKVRASLLTDKDGPMLSLYDENSETRAILAADKDGPMLSLYDEKGKPRVGLFADKNGPCLRLYDKDGKSRVGLTALKDGPALVLVDENGKFRVGLIVNKDGPSLMLLDENAKARAWLTAFKDGPSLILSDKNGKGRAALGVDSCKAADGKTINYPESSLLLFNPDGTLRWSAP